MTEEQQREAIAKFCGVDFSYALPNYLGDLNAMHAAEEKLTDEQQRNYFCFALHDAVNGSEYFDGHKWYAHASAAQRAEAFLRTLSLWKDS
jgi:hypothetical protein